MSVDKSVKRKLINYSNDLDTSKAVFTKESNDWYSLVIDGTDMGCHYQECEMEKLSKEWGLKT